MEMLRLLVVHGEGERQDIGGLLRHSPEVGAVVDAPAAEACLAALENGHFDGVFIPDAVLARRVAAVEPALPLVLIGVRERGAVDAFAIGAVDFLRPPVPDGRLALTLDRLSRRADQGPVGAAREALADRLPVMSGERILLLPLEEIRVVAMEADHVYAYTTSGRYPSRLSLAALALRVQAHGFLRVHRRFVVNLRHVASISTFFNGTYELELHGPPHFLVPVSRRHAAELRVALRL